MIDSIDEALEILKDTGPEYGGGLSNHGPMAAEALLSLRRPDAVDEWIAGYKLHLSGHPKSRDPISQGNWREALGDYARVGDWVKFFERELSESPWDEVLDEWAAKLAPGLAAAATHGLIRTGHAARSLARTETPQRLHELAEGLGYWSARFVRLPETSSDNSLNLAPSEAISQVKTMPERSRHAGLISDGLEELSNFPDFNDVINLVGTRADPMRFISDLTETFAHIYLANARDFMSTIVFIHSVTGPSAIRLLAPHLKPGTTEALLRYGWQVAAGLYARFGRNSESSGAKAPGGGVEEIIDRAIATGDEHAIKFTEACLREYATNPKPVYLIAARDVSERL
jgi:hypothetical protein